jgi:DNA-binding MarR family transcriptional regulator
LGNNAPALNSPADYLRSIKVTIRVNCKPDNAGCQRFYQSLSSNHFQVNSTDGLLCFDLTFPAQSTNIVKFMNNLSYSQSGNPNNADIEKIVDSLLQVLPVFHRKLLRMDLGGIDDNISRPHMGIMFMLHRGSKTVSEMAKIMMVPKPQMTYFIDHLVELGAVERRPDSMDRRVINLVLTDYGNQLLTETKRKVHDNIKSKLAGLSPEELAKMTEALETLKGIGSRL